MCAWACAAFSSSISNIELKWFNSVCSSVNGVCMCVNLMSKTHALSVYSIYHTVQHYNDIHIHIESVIFSNRHQNQRGRKRRKNREKITQTNNNNRWKKKQLSCCWLLFLWLFIFFLSLLHSSRHQSSNWIYLTILHLILLYAISTMHGSFSRFTTFYISSLISRYSE